MGPLFQLCRGQKNLILHLWLQSSAPKLHMEFTGGYIAYMDPMGTVIHFSGYHIEIQSSLHCREATRLPMHRYALVGNGPLGEGTFGLVWRRRNMTSFTKCPALVAPRMIGYGSSWDSGCRLDHCTNSLHCAGARQSLPK